MLKKIINLTRIKDWVHILGLPILGFVSVSNEINAIVLLIVVIMSSLLLAFAYSYDISFDILRYRKVRSYPTFKTSLFLSLLFLLLSFFLSITVSYYMLILVVLFSIVVLIYLTPSIDLKSMPYIGTFLNATGFSILFLIGGSLSEITLEIIYVWTLVLITMIPFQIVHEIQDMREDRRNKVITTAVKLGKEKTRKLVYVSLFVLLLWPVMLYYLGYTIYISLATFIFCSSAAILLYTKKNIRKIHFRYIAFIYGFMLLLIFLMK